MNIPITWEDYINFRIVVGAFGLILALLIGTIVTIVRYQEELHVNDDPDPNELPAGKTLGL